MHKELAITPVRQIVLDTETTGMNQNGINHYEGHKIIEIGAVEIINRRLTGNHFHVYLNPQRAVDDEAYEIHQLSDAFLADKPLYKEIAPDFIKFIDGAELVIHNASFDVSFMDYEFGLMGSDYKIAEHCLVTDTLALARKIFPGKRNNLDILCERYQIDNTQRTAHGALLDAQLLAEVYLAMTGGQTSLTFTGNDHLNETQLTAEQRNRIVRTAKSLTILYATEDELTQHEHTLEKIDKKSQGSTLWRAKPETVLTR